jgi:RNA polymerase sigma-70 factor (ECF subfamily)
MRRVNDERGTDARLATRIRSGDTGALGELYDRYASTALATALRVVGGRDEAEDVVHDAFVAVWRKVDRFDADRGSLRGWLMTVVRNRAIDRVRARRPTVDVDAADELSLLRTGPNPTWEDALGRAAAGDLRLALAELPVEQRRAVELAYFEGYTYREVAELTGVPAGTANGRLRLRRHDTRGGPPMTERPPLDCSAVDELAASYALGAVDPGEDRAISAHLATCDQPHGEARSHINMAAVLTSSLERVAPSPGLRERLMATIEDTPQHHRPAVAPVRRPVGPLEASRRPAWSRLSPLPSALAAVMLAAAIGLGAWGITLNGQLAERDAALRAVASADAIYAASGAAGSGWVIESGDEAMFMAEDLADLPPDRLYEFWLIDADGNAVAAGTLTDSDGVVLVTLERDLEDATTFAVTVETERVDQSVNEPVMVAAIGA